MIETAERVDLLGATGTSSFSRNVSGLPTEGLSSVSDELPRFRRVKIGAQCKTCSHWRTRQTAPTCCNNAARITILPDEVLARHPPTLEGLGALVLQPPLLSSNGSSTTWRETHEWTRFDRCRGVRVECVGRRFSGR